MRILVTGAKGFVGKNLCSQLKNIKEGTTQFIYNNFICKYLPDALDVADRMAEETTERYTHEEIFAKMREAVND